MKSVDNLGSGMRANENSASQNGSIELDERREHVNVSSMSNRKINLLAE
jgi:hypothetical protein